MKDNLEKIFQALSNKHRIDILRYCLESGTGVFSDIIFDLKLNPNTFAFHARKLIDCGLLRKIGVGCYKITFLGEKAIELFDAEKQYLITV